VLPVLALAYVLSPIDLVPDMVAVLGQVDDISLLLAAVSLFRRLAPRDLVAFHQSAMERRQQYAPMPGTGSVIDPEWRHEP
jgi:uncharacterized membrane protein YkvA (DUF1232 family)